MNDDFNTAKAISVIFDFIGFVNKHIKREKIDVESLKEYKRFVFDLCGILGLKIEVRGSIIDNGEVEELINKRKLARENKDFTLADKIRKNLDARGIILEDTAYGTKWSKK